MGPSVATPLFKHKEQRFTKWCNCLKLCNVFLKVARATVVLHSLQCKPVSQSVQWRRCVLMFESKNVHNKWLCSCESALWWSESIIYTWSMLGNKNIRFDKFLLPRLETSRKCLVFCINNSCAWFCRWQWAWCCSVEQNNCSSRVVPCCFLAALPLHAWMCMDQLVPFWASGRAEGALDNRGGLVHAEKLRDS